MYIVGSHDGCLLSQSEFYIELLKSLILEGQPSQAGILLKLREGGRVSNLTYDYILLYKYFLYTCIRTFIHTYIHTHALFENKMLIRKRTLKNIHMYTHAITAIHCCLFCTSCFSYGWKWVRMISSRTSGPLPAEQLKRNSSSKKKLVPAKTASKR